MSSGWSMFGSSARPELTLVISCVNQNQCLVCRLWALGTSLCWVGVTEESPLWLQLPQILSSLRKWSFGDPTPSFLRKTSNFTTVRIRARFYPFMIFFFILMHMFWGTFRDPTVVRDVSRWSARMRQPMEVYGSQVFAQTWEAWVDGITQFAKRPGGEESLNFILI